MSVIINNFFLAIPFYFLWNSLAPIYAEHLWPEYREVPFWHIVGIFTLFSIIRLALFPKSRAQSNFQFRTFRFNQHNPYATRDYRQAEPDFSQESSYIKDVTPKHSE